MRPLNDIIILFCRIVIDIVVIAGTGASAEMVTVFIVRSNLQTIRPPGVNVAGDDGIGIVVDDPVVGDAFGIVPLVLRSFLL